MSFISNLFGGGGGGSQQTAPQSTTTTVQNTNIPTYAQPYVQNMLNATQSQLFQTDSNGNITGFNQYTPYSGMNQQDLQNAQQAVAGFSPLQQQAQSSAANLQVPGQYNAATQLGSAAGIGALGTTGQANAYGMMGNRAGQQGSFLSNAYGGLGAQSGQQAAGMSSAYGGQGSNLGMQSAALGASANPYDFQQQVGGYMNPYIQQSLAPGLQLLNQQTGIQSAGEQSAATSAGAFGGSREALANALTQQNGQMAASNMIGQAYNNAFSAAQNQYNQNGAFQMQGLNQALTGNAQGLQGANQAGSQAMQGYGMGLQGAGQAGQLGISGAQAGIAGIGAQQAGYNLAGTQANNLANIGNQQLAAQQGIIGTQAQQGALQQQNQQQVINQGIQNYATAQQYPLMELGTMSNMLRGLPMQSATTQQYQATPTALTQAVGAAGVASQLAAKGGGLLKTKKYAGGGILDATRNDLEAMPIDALQKEENTTNSPTIKSQIKQILAMRAGAPMTAAGGGILAFSDGDLAQTPPEVARGNALLADYNQQLIDASNSKFNFGQSSQTPTDTSTSVSAPTQSGANDQAVAQAYIEAAQLKAAQNKAAQAAAPTSAPVQNAVRGRGAPPIPQAPAGIMQANTPSAPTSTPGTILSGRGVPIQQDVSPRVAAARAYEAKQAAAQATAQQDQTQQTPPPAATQAAPQGQAPQGQPPAQNPAAITAAAPQGQAPQATKPQVDPHKAIEAHAQKDLTQKLNDPNVTNWAQLLLPGDDYIKAQLADKAAYVGPNNVESQVAALKDRQAREMKTADTRDKLVKAQMFAKMATTPGSFITAALTGVSSAIPGLIANADKRDEALNHIDDAIANVYKADRLEKSGDYDAAQKAKEKVVENTINGYKAVWQAKSEMIKAQADMAKVGVESQKLGVDKGILNFQKASGQYDAVVKQVQTEKEKDRAYGMDKRMLDLAKDQLSRDPANKDLQLKVSNAEAKVKPKEDAWDRRIEEKREYRDRFDTDKIPTGKSNASGGSKNVIKLD